MCTPKEIEDVLNEIEKIDETAVFGISDNDFGERVVAACLLYTSPSPRDRIRSRMPSSA